MKWSLTPVLAASGDSVRSQIDEHALLLIDQRDVEMPAELRALLEQHGELPGGAAADAGQAHVTARFDRGADLGAQVCRGG